jgi:hypothetical protein
MATRTTPDVTQQAFQQLVEAFLDRDHSRYALVMATALREHVFGPLPPATKIQLLRLWLIRLQRVEQG